MPKWNSPYWTEHDRKAALEAERIEKYAKLRYNGDGTIVVTDDMTHKKHYSPRPMAENKNSVIEYRAKKGGHRREIFGEDCRKVKEIHADAHGNPGKHPFGKHGEHAHDWVWDGERHERGKARELTEQERVEHGDIL